METPTLTKKQRKATLSAKKGKLKETIPIKNVLSTPYNASYWPLLSEKETTALKKILTVNLPRMRLTKISIPWSEVKVVPKTQRKDFREGYVKKLDIKEEVDKMESAHLCIGTNDVSKHLETDLLCAVLINLEVHPRLMVQHLIDQAVTWKVPVLIVNNLKTILQKRCGIGGIALGIKKTAVQSLKLSIVIKRVMQLSQRYPIPQDHLNYITPTPTLEVKSENDSKDHVIHEEDIRQLYYLRRESRSERVFIPKNEVVDKTSDEVMEVSYEEPPKKKLKTKYKPLKVKKIKGDPNRKKRIGKL